MWVIVKLIVMRILISQCYLVAELLWCLLGCVLIQYIIRKGFFIGQTMQLQRQGKFHLAYHLCGNESSLGYIAIEGKRNGRKLTTCGCFCIQRRSLRNLYIVFPLVAILCYWLRFCVLHAYSFFLVFFFNKMKQDMSVALSIWTIWRHNLNYKIDLLHHQFVILTFFVCDKLTTTQRSNQGSFY